MTRRGLRILGTLASLLMVATGIWLREASATNRQFVGESLTAVGRVQPSPSPSPVAQSMSWAADPLLPTATLEAAPSPTPTEVSPLSFVGTWVAPTPEQALVTSGPDVDDLGVIDPVVEQTPRSGTSPLAAATPEPTQVVAQIAAQPQEPPVAPTPGSASATTTTERPIAPGPATSSTITVPAVVKVDANVRAGPGASFEVVRQWSAGTSVVVLARKGDWVQVERAGGQQGWVNGVLELPPWLRVEMIPEIERVEMSIQQRLSKFDAVATEDVVIHDKPDEESSTPFLIPEQAGVFLLGRNDDEQWVLVGDEVGSVGWVLAASLQIAPGLAVSQLPDMSPDEMIMVWEGMQFGGQTHTFDNYQAMGDIGMRWVKIQFKWDPERKPEDVADRVRQAHERGFKILLATTGSPYPDVIDYDAYVSFLGGVAALPQPPDAIEVWNEMNIDFEWPVGSIDPDAYVKRMLAPAYTAIKQANSDIVVISGAPAPTGFNNTANAWSDERYVAGMVRAGAADYLDCVGIHYNSAATSPYATSGHPAGSFYGWYFEPHLSTYHRAFNGSRPLCITELGILSKDGYGLLPERFWWASATTLADQGQWLAEAKGYAAELGYINMLIIFSVDIFHWDDFDPQSGYALFRRNGDCPSCNALRPTGGFEP